MDALGQTYPHRLSQHFKQFTTNEILYTNAYEAIVYGNVYRNRHNITDEWVAAASEIPLQSDYIGSEYYRRYLMVFMAHRCKIASRTERMVEYQCLDADHLLTDKSRGFVLSEIIYNALKEENYSEVMPLYARFLVENTLDDYEQKVTDIYEKILAFSPGAAALGFRGTDQSGRNVRSEDLCGKLIYLNFWAGYCGSCLRKIAYMNTRFDELERHGVQVVNVSIDPSNDVWQQNLVQHNIGGLNLLSKGEQTTDIAKDFKVEAIPTYFIIDKNGMFVQKPLSSKPEDLVKFLLERGTNLKNDMRILLFIYSMLSATTSLVAQSDVQPVYGICIESDAQKQRSCSDLAVVTFLSKHLKYPSIARENNIQGTVVVRFVVNKDGSTTDHQLLRDIGGGCGEEAIRVIKSMGNWKPGMTAGNPVNAQMTLPIKFKLEAEAHNTPQYTLYLGVHTAERLSGKELAEALNAPITVRDNSGSSLKVHDLSLTIEKRGKSLTETAQGAQPSKAMHRIARKAKKGGSALLEARIVQDGITHTVQRSITIQ